MTRTTILLDDHLLLEVRSLANRKGTTTTEVIKDALIEYIQKQPARGLPSFTGIGKSKGKGTGRLSEKIEESLPGKINPYEGSRGRHR
jgi:hypothetical protein